MQTLTEHSPLGYLLKASWQAAVLILLVLAAQKIFGRRLSPRWRYSLWLLVIFRLALPWTVPSGASLFNVLNLLGHSAPATSTAAVAADSSTSPSAATVTAEPTSQALKFKWPGRQALSGPRFWLLTGWLVGALVLAVYLVATHWRFPAKWPLAARLPTLPF